MSNATGTWMLGGLLTLGLVVAVWFAIARPVLRRVCPDDARPNVWVWVIGGVFVLASSPFGSFPFMLALALFIMWVAPHFPWGTQRDP